MGFVVSWKARLAAALSSGVIGAERVFPRDLLLLAWRSGVLLKLRRRLEVGVVLGPAGLALFLRGEATLAVVSGGQSWHLLFRQQCEAFGKLDREHNLRERD